MRIKLPRNWIKTLCGAAGLLLFVYLILRTGVGPLLENLSRFGIWFPAILAVGASWLFFQACAWSIIQNAYFRKVPFGRLLCVRVIGDALNILLPSASLGGDAARAYMIRDQTPLKEGIAGVLFDKTIEFISSTVFLAASLLLGSLFIKMPEGLLAPTILCLIVTTAGLVFLVFFSARGFYDILLRISGILPGVKRWIIHREDKIKSLEGNLRLLYRKGNLKSLKLVAALGFHFLARVAGAVEVLIILRVLGLPVDFIQAFFIFSVVVITNTIFFLLPGQWGITESASILVLQSLGYPAALGLSLSVIRRIRKLAFVALALILFFVEKKRLPEKGERSIAY